MDYQTLAVIDLLLLLLYAAATLLHGMMFRDGQEGLRGGKPFIAANVGLAAALGLSMVAGALANPLLDGVFVLLILGSHVMLHRGFGELLEEEQTLWRVQLGMAAIGMAAWLYCLRLPGTASARALPALVWGLQYAVIAALLFRRSEAGLRLGRWFAGSVAALFAICHVVTFGAGWLWMWVPPGLRSAAPGRASASVGLLTHGAMAFAFLTVGASRLRLRLEQEAQADELTGLMNRRAIRRAAERALARCRRRKGMIAVVMFDVDGLKQVNDRLGHGAGDALLRAVADGVPCALREGDKLARLGGDEFCLLLPDADEREALRVAERCRWAIAGMMVRYHGEMLRTSASFGVAHSDDCGLEWGELLEQSDAALYRAKRDGRNRVIVGEGIEVREMAVVGSGRRRAG